MISHTSRGVRVGIVADDDDRHVAVGIDDAPKGNRKKTIQMRVFEPWEVRRIARFLLQAANAAEGKRHDERVPTEDELGIVVPSAPKADERASASSTSLTGASK